MSKPKILIFAPREEPPSIISQLEGAGLQIALGSLDWQLPRGDHEDAFAAAARDTVALMGTSIRHTPVSRRIMEGSQRLRIVAKYTVGVDDVDVEAATDLGIMVCHAPTESNCFAVAETTVAMMLTILKKVRERDASVRAGKWRQAGARRQLCRQPTVGRLSRHHAGHRGPGPHRQPRGAIAGALAHPHPGL